MHRSSSRQRDMNIENVPAANIQGPTGRVTRARAKVFGASAGLPPLQPVAKQDHKRAPLTVVAPTVQAKKRAVLKDITNNSFNESSIKVPNGNKAQISKRVKRCAVKKNEKVARSIPVDPQIQKRNTKAAETVTKQSANKLCEANSQLTSENDITISVGTMLELNLSSWISDKHYGHGSSSQNVLLLYNAGESIITVEVEATNDESVIDIDSKHKGPQMCSLYAAEIHANLCTNELKWRHSADYMKTVQLEITQEMRSILIDWLVEVCEEYGLASETFYLTVALIDIYLSKKCIGKRRLQLLGITCMLVASKYEEICAPRVEEFCFITDSTYTRADVLEMEHQILDVLSFQLSVPTIKKFLRLRFLLAAQSSYKAPVIELEFLANYLAELSQIEYRFVKFLPSLIAASAVYLAKWTLDQDEDPWNATLEHYTSYKAPELKVTVLALQDLQLNNASALHAIRQKYKQQKVNALANYSPITIIIMNHDLV
ncbi:putative cyclin domain-containing protein [Helianthus annuus]|nr:putative cyclin domain-containing protein [Helianthus annuus]KAJ0635082.1 putative cyclin domain-containing protein [Helianthus annuus]